MYRAITVNKYKDLIMAAQDYIFHHPETGYKEWKTGRYMEEAFEKLGYTLTRAESIPGFYTVLDTGREGPEVLILGELDSIICREHPCADRETGAAHACGHSAQCAALLGIAAVLKEKDALDGLSGRIRLCAVPAEELIEIEYRTRLQRDGVIKYLGGKSEFLHRGYFDGVDMAFMVHTAPGEYFAAKAGAIGCITKSIIYKGVSAHAGGCPWDGCNALYAATQGISAANALRETFRDSDMIRFHPIMTAGGDAVNAIPDRVVIESYVRGVSFPAILDANRRINRALCGGALSLGANVDIRDMPGYAPLHNAPAMISLAKDAAAALDLPYACDDTISTGCTDMGDLSVLMPVVHPYAPGAVGLSHGADYMIEDPELACVSSAAWQLEMLRLLLENGAARAKEILASFTPAFSSKQAYFDYIDAFTAQGDRIDYRDGRACVTLSADTANI